VPVQGETQTVYENAPAAQPIMGHSKTAAVLAPTKSKPATQLKPITRPAKELPVRREQYTVPQVQTVRQEKPYFVDQPVIQPYIQRVIRQKVPVITQQIQEVPVPVVRKVPVQGETQTVYENAPAAKPIMAQPVMAPSKKTAAHSIGTAHGETAAPIPAHETAAAQPSMAHSETGAHSMAHSEDKPLDSATAAGDE
jgi:hypothetical protein